MTIEYAKCKLRGKKKNIPIQESGRIEGLLAMPEEVPLPRWVTPLIDTSYAFIPLDLGEDGFTSSANLTLIRGGLSFLLSSAAQLELAAGYDSYTDLYDGLSVSLGTTVRVSGPGNGSIPREDFSPGTGAGFLDGYIRFTSVELDRVFPVLYKYYDDHPMGRAIVINEGPRPPMRLF